MVFGVSLFLCLTAVPLTSECRCLVDQPAGTGFSYVSTDRYVHDIATVSLQRRS